MPSEPIDSRAHRVLSGVSRVAVLEVVRSGGPLDVQAIAERVGLHPNTVRSHLDQLIEAGLVESSVNPRTTPGRPRLHFSSLAGADAGPRDSYRMLAEILAGAIGESAPEPGAAAAAMGRRWGHEVARAGPEHVDRLDARGAVDRIVALLDDVGFAPTIADVPPCVATAAADGDGDGDGDPTVIELHRCPFVEVAREHSDIVCAVHLGLMQGALEQMQAPPTTVRLEPFVRPDLCLAHLVSTGTGVKP